jgi:hypothetical protein
MVKCIIGIVVFIVLIPCCILGTYKYDCYQCSQKTSGIGIPHRNLFIDGCQIYVNESWIPLENYGCQIYVNESWIPLENYRFLGD